MDRQEKARGSLLGLAVGDALGFPLEGLSSKQIKRRFGEQIDRYRFLGNTGYVSDDTEQAVMVAQSLLSTGLNPEAAAEEFGRRLFRWFLTMPPGIGRATLRACLLRPFGVRRGTASAGNGAAMRMAVVGLLPEWRPDLIRANAIVTHTDSRAIDGALLVALGVYRIMQSQSIDWPELNSALELDPRLTEIMERAWSLSLAQASPDTVATELGTSGYVLHSVALAFSAVWSQPQTFLEGLQRILLQGGDTDSNAAIAGALLGAHFGAAAIDAALLDRLEPCYNRQRLCLVADCLVEGSAKLPAEPTFLKQRYREAKIKTAVCLHVLRRLVPI